MNLKKCKNFCKYFFGDIKSNYKFSIKDRFIGAKLCVNGYTNRIQESITNVDDKLIFVKLNNISFFANKDVFKPGELKHIYSEIFLPFTINPHAYETDFIRIKPGDVVFDIGACEGMFSLHALNKDAAKIYLFEPAKVLYKSLAKTFEIEMKNNKVSLFNNALSNKTGFYGFNTNKEYICMAKLDETSTDVVETITLDDFVQNTKPDKIDFIKADIEGAEVDFMTGAVNVIKNLRPKFSLAIYHHHNNATQIAEIINGAEHRYKIKFSGCYMYERPYRPFMLYAWI